MARGDATSIESMHQKEAKCACKDHTQYYRTVGNVWDSLYAKQQLRESNITLDRIYTMLAEFLIELKLHEEQDKIAQIITGSSGTAKCSMYDEYINASKGKVPSKGNKSNWRSACEEYWKPGGCSQGHRCPKYHPRRQPGRCAICGSTHHYTSQCTRPVKPRAKSTEWDETTWQQDEVEWQDSQWEIEEYEASNGKKGKGKGSKPKGKSKGKVYRDRLRPGQHSLNPLEETDLNPKPNPKHAHA